MLWLPFLVDVKHIDFKDSKVLYWSENLKFDTHRHWQFQPETQKKKNWSAQSQMGLASELLSSCWTYKYDLTITMEFVDALQELIECMVGVAYNQYWRVLLFCISPHNFVGQQCLNNLQAHICFSSARWSLELEILASLSSPSVWYSFSWLVLNTYQWIPQKYDCLTLKHCTTLETLILKHVTCMIANSFVSATFNAPICDSSMPM